MAEVEKRIHTRAVLLTLNDQLYRALFAVLTPITDEQILYIAPSIDRRCIRDVAIHAYRPVLAVACVAANHSWPARPLLSRSVDELFTLLESMHIQIEDLFEELHDEMLARPISLPWVERINCLEALLESLGHGLQHVGALQGIRALGGFPVRLEDE
jgi:hypothetical protein